MLLVLLSGRLPAQEAGDSLKSGTDSAIEIRSIFDKYGMRGTMLIIDAATGRHSGYQPALWDSGYLPASTFKIPNTLVGLETGVIDTNYVFKWDEKKRYLPQWERDLRLRDAFRTSCVPCYQELARKIGPDRMKATLEKTGYPGMDVRKENIDLFWLEGDSRITPRQQAHFLERLYRETLPLQRPVMQAVKSIMLIEVTPGYSLSGKTGWAVRNGNNYGWFVGWLETGGKVFYIATLVEPNSQVAVTDFAAARKQVTMDVLRALGLIAGEGPR